MQQKISRSLGVSLNAAFWLLATPAIAQHCDVIVSHPEIQLGNQHYSANTETLFARQEMTLTAQCAGEGPMTLRIDGMSDAGGQRFRFGTTGGMTLSLLAAQYDGVNTSLRLISAQQGERQIASRQPVLLSPGSQLTTPVAADTGMESHLLQLQLRLDFPATGNEGRIRDFTQLEGLVRFEARQ